MEDSHPHPHPHPRPGRLSRCELHPHDDNNNNGISGRSTGSFCPSCLRDRLSGLDLDLDLHNGSDGESAAAPAHPHPHPVSSHLRRCSSSSSIKPIKMHILDLQSQSIKMRNSSEPKSNFWITKYWHHWRHPRPRPRPRSQPTHSDADPRFSIHHAPSAGARASFDCPPPPRFSFDAHSASTRPLISSHPFHPLQLNDHQNQLPVELDHDDSDVPGSQSQTRDYYLHSSTSNRHHRRSFERSASLRKMSTPPLPHMDTDHRSLHPAFNSKVSPAGNAEFYHHHPSVANQDGIAMSMSGSFSSAFQFQDPCKTQVAPDKKHKKWSKGWNLWGLIQRKGNTNCKDQPPNSAKTSGHSDHFLRCNSSVSARSSFSSYSAAGSMRRNSVDIININSHANSHNRRDDQLVLERNRSARFSPSQVDNGMLRLYLTPTRGNQTGRRNSGVRPVTTGSQSMSSRPVHRLY